MKNRTFVLGDIHGGYKALLQVLERVKFDYENDTLIALGDVCDGWSETPEAIEELLKIKNLIYIKGNHDFWAYRGLTNSPGFMKFSGDGPAWMYHGGKATMDAYERRPELLEKHTKFLNEAKPYYLDSENRLFVHAGFHQNIHVSETPEDVLIWDRSFWYAQYSGKNFGKEYKEVYIGHTPTLNFPDNKGGHFRPINRKNTWNMDTGAAFDGRLSIMDIDTKEITQSDVVRELYPYEFGRNQKAFAREVK